MELRHLRYFIAVAEELNFTRAALRLHTAQPSLSQQIRDLEDQVGTRLLERSRHKVELTASGEVFLAEARLTLAQADRAISRARQVIKQKSTLTIGFVPAAEVRIFPIILPMLRMRFPELIVDLRSLPTMDLEEALLKGEIDVAFMREPLLSPNLVSEIVLTEPLLVILPATHALAKLDRIPLHMLNGEAFISSHPKFSGRVYDIVDEYCKKNNLQQNIVQVASNILLNLNLVGMGLGYALLPAYVEKLIHNSVCCRPLDCDPPSIDLLMVWQMQNPSGGIAALRDLVRTTSTIQHQDKHI